MQSSLPQDMVPLESSTLLAIISTSYAVFMAIGQTVFQKRLEADLGAVVSPEVVNKIILRVQQGSHTSTCKCFPTGNGFSGMEIELSLMLIFCLLNSTSLHLRLSLLSC